VLMENKCAGIKVLEAKKLKCTLTTCSLEKANVIGQKLPLASHRGGQKRKFSTCQNNGRLRSVLKGLFNSLLDNLWGVCQISMLIAIMNYCMFELLRISQLNPYSSSESFRKETLPISFYQLNSSDFS
jgi:hypothetical protein